MDLRQRRLVSAGHARAGPHAHGGARVLVLACVRVPDPAAGSGLDLRQRRVVSAGHARAGRRTIRAASSTGALDSLFDPTAGG